MYYVNQKQCKDGWYTKFTDCRGYWYRRNNIGSFKFIAPFTHVSIYFLHCIYSILISCLQVNLEFFTSLRQQKIIHSIEGLTRMTCWFSSVAVFKRRWSKLSARQKSGKSYREFKKILMQRNHRASKAPSNSI